MPLAPGDRLGPYELTASIGKGGMGDMLRRSPEQFLERTYTNALFVMKDGRIVTEIYRNNTSESSRFIGWSMTKSVTSVLIGCALAENRIDSLDTPVTRYLPELKGGGYDRVSIRQIMQMRSGVDYEERYDFENPGTAASNHIAALVRNTARCLWEPLGAEPEGFYIMDGAPGTGREFRRIVSEDRVRQSTRPSGGAAGQRSGYGLQWWIMGASDAYAAIGLQGQYTYVDPATRTVAVKLSDFPPGDNSALDGEMRAFMAAASAWKPR